MWTKIGLGVGLLLLCMGSFYAGKYSKGVDKNTQTEHVEDTTKTVIVEKRPDGTVVETVKHETHTEIKKEVQTVTVQQKLPEWKIGVGYGRSLDNFSRDSYLFTASKKVLGNVSVGAWGTSEKQVGVLVGVEF